MGEVGPDNFEQEEIKQSSHFQNMPPTSTSVATHLDRCQVYLEGGSQNKGSQSQPHITD